jgi:hypothetical protein
MFFFKTITGIVSISQNSLPERIAPVRVTRSSANVENYKILEKSKNAKIEKCKNRKLSKNIKFWKNGQCKNQKMHANFEK